MATAITMWDFSWLQRRRPGENEYEDVAAVVDGLVERGYQCVRVDAFPHLVSAARRDPSIDHFTVTPEPEHFMWGAHHQPIVIRDPAAALLDFIRTCDDRGVTVALSSWFNHDDRDVRAAIVTPDDLAAVWIATIELVEQAGLLDAVEYLDLCNEFPLHLWLPSVYRRIFGDIQPDAASPGGPGVDEWIWTAAERHAIEEYLAIADRIRERWPTIPVTMSYAPASQSVHDLDVSRLDFIETHVWLNTNVREFGRAVAFRTRDHGFPGAYQKTVDTLDDLYWPDPQRWHAQLGAEMRRWRDTGARAGKPLWTTEGWSNVLMDEFTSAGGRSSWDFVRSVAEYAVPLAVELGWQGICTSNFSQPHFPGLWNDIEWHRRMTGIIRGA